MSTYNNISIPKELLTKDGRINAALIRRDHFKKTPFYIEVMEKTKFLQQDATFTERLYCIENNITQPVKCIHCNAFVKFNPNKKEYNKTCKKCFCIDRKTDLNKLSQTKKENINKYRDDFFHSYTNKKYNLIHEQELMPYVKEKTNKALYGNSSVLVYAKQLEIEKDSLCSVLYYTSNILEIKPEEYNWSERFYILLNGLQDIPQCKYCNKSATYISLKDGYRKTCGSKKCTSEYGGFQRTLSHIKDHINAIESQGYKLLTNIDSTYKGLNNGPLKFYCTKCNNEFERIVNNGRIYDISCPICTPASESKGEIELKEFLKELNVDFVSRDKNIISPLELDVFIPSKQIAIEYNGIYWHSDEHKPKDYHITKTNLCKNKNIQLIHIFSTEWENKKDIVKSIIKSKLGIIDQKVFARKCQLRTLTPKEYRKYFELNHLQGSCNGSVCYGLLYENKIICAALFGKRKITKGDVSWELLRFANTLNTSVVGGFSKILKHFIKNDLVDEKLITYADVRYSNGDLYINNGFTLSHISKPNYWYAKSNTNTLFNRVNFQKHKLKNILENFDPSLTEHQNMKNNKYYRVYDCGQMVFSYKQ